MLYINDGTITAGKKPAIKVTVMPGKHVPPGPLSVANDLSKAVPPTNGWMVELGYSSAGNDESLENGYRCRPQICSAIVLILSQSESTSQETR